MEAWGVLAFRMLQGVNRGSRANGKGDKPGGPIGLLAIDPDSDPSDLPLQHRE